MKRILGLWCLLCASAQLMASGAELLEQVVGKYSILHMNGNPRVSGWLFVSRDDNFLGYRIAPVPMASVPVAPTQLFTPEDSTQVSQFGSVIHQEFASEGLTVVVDYIIEKGFLVVSANQCQTEPAECTRDFIVASSGDSPGALVDTRAFFEARKGPYDLLLAGGNVPKPENNKGSVIPGETEGWVKFSYCPPDGGFCDPGFFFFDYEKTKVFERKISEALVIYDIVLKSDNETTFFSWVEDSGKVLFRNLKYKLYEAFVCLEHEAQPAP